jgi:hypothetical protein
LTAIVSPTKPVIVAWQKSLGEFMRLDSACFVVAREPHVPSIPTRRAFLLAGVAFAAGAACGGVGMYAATNRSAASAGGDTGEIDRATGLKPTGSSDLDTLRRWALQDSLDDLESNMLLFFEQLRSRFQRDAFLWHGMERLADRIDAGATAKWPRGARQLHLQMIESLVDSDSPSNAKRLQARAPSLRRTK